MPHSLFDMVLSTRVRKLLVQYTQRCDSKKIRGIYMHVIHVHDMAYCTLCFGGSAQNRHNMSKAQCRMYTLL